MKTLIALTVISLLLNIYTLLRLMKHERGTDWTKEHKKDWRFTAWIIDKYQRIDK